MRSYVPASLQLSSLLAPTESLFHHLNTLEASENAFGERFEPVNNPVKNCSHASPDGSSKRKEYDEPPLALRGTVSFGPKSIAA